MWRLKEEDKVKVTTAKNKLTDCECRLQVVELRVRLFLIGILLIAYLWKCICMGDSILWLTPASMSMPVQRQQVFQRCIY